MGVVSARTRGRGEIEELKRSARFRITIESKLVQNNFPHTRILILFGFSKYYYSEKNIPTRRRIVVFLSFCFRVHKSHPNRIRTLLSRVIDKTFIPLRRRTNAVETADSNRERRGEISGSKWLCFHRALAANTYIDQRPVSFASLELAAFSHSHPSPRAHVTSCVRVRTVIRES